MRKNIYFREVTCGDKGGEAACFAMLITDNPQ
jgi:hypothetical protein